MHVALIGFDGFTDVDLFMPWDLFYRVRDPHYAAYVMARLSQRGTASHFVQVRDKLGHPAYKVMTRGYASRAAAETAAGELRKRDLHPNGVVEASGG